MKFRDLKRHMKVQDVGYAEYGTGTVREILKTCARINFTREGLVTYDAAHVQFLEPVDDNPRKSTRRR